MSKASEDLEKRTEGDVPTAGEVASATAAEAAEAARGIRSELEVGIKRDPLRSIAIAAGVGFVAALLARRF